MYVPPNDTSSPHVIPAKAGIQYKMACEAHNKSSARFTQRIQLDSGLRRNDGGARTGSIYFVAGVAAP